MVSSEELVEIRRYDLGVDLFLVAALRPELELQAPVVRGHLPGLHQIATVVLEVDSVELAELAVHPQAILREAGLVDPI